MKDVFHEQIVERKKKGQDYLFQVGLVLLVILASFALFIFSPLLSAIGTFIPLIIIGLGYGAYQIIITRNIEYEYIITNGEIDVDRIINRSRRKRMITFQADMIEDIGFYKKQQHAHKKYGKIYRYCQDESDEINTIYIDYNSKDDGKVQILLSPNEDILEAIKKRLPRHLFEKLKKV